MPEVVNTSALSFGSDQAIEAEGVQLEDDRPTAIKVENVSMVFNMASERLNNLKEYFLKIVKHQLFFEELVALDDISFEVKKGDVFGILGTNGSGKSTLLKIVAGVLEPTRGKVEINGAIAPLIELGAGFDMDLSARENIFLNGALLGYSKEFIQEHFDDIVEFAEVEKFLDMPMKNYSSGMVARIAFAIATVMVPEILIVDEVLSVGDFMFQQKCEDRITELIERHGVTVLIVSHSNDQIERLCNKAIWIEKGHPRIMGDAAQVCNAYRVLGGRTGSAESEKIVFEALKRAEEETRPRLPCTTIPGGNHVALACNMALDSWTDADCESVVLVPDFSHAFALSVAGVAGALEAPLLPFGANEIDPQVVSTLLSLGPNNIFILGTDEEFAELSESQMLARLDARLVHIPRHNDVTTNRNGIIGFGLDHALLDGKIALVSGFSSVSDAFEAAPLAYANKLPFLIVDDDLEKLSESHRRALSDMETQMVIVIGSLSTSALASNLEQSGYDVIRIDRMSYAHSILEVLKPVFGTSSTGLSPTRACIGSKQSSRWQDLIATPAYCGKERSSLILEDTTDLDDEVNCLRQIASLAPHELTFIENPAISPLDKEILIAAGEPAR